MKERSNFWDNYKGILIALVVFGHFIYDYATNTSNDSIKDVFQFIYLFHMPAFVFCSGYFSKSEKACDKKSLCKLFLCYLVINIPLLLYYTLQGSVIQLITPYASAWYLLALIAWRITIKYVAQLKGILSISVIAAVAVGFAPEFSNILSMSRIVAFFPFFLVGYRLKEENVKLFLEKRTRGKRSLWCFVAVILSVYIYIISSEIDFPVSVLTMQPYHSYVEMYARVYILLCAVVMIAVMMLIVPERKIPILTQIGKNSLTVYLAHRLLTLFFSEIFLYTRFNAVYLVFAIVATVAVLLIFGSNLISKWFNHILDTISDEVMDSQSRTGKRAVSLLLVLILLFPTIPLARKFTGEFTSHVDVSEVIDNAVVLSYVGDLILLKDQVEAAYDEITDEYNFTPMFEYTKSYLSEADLAIGIFEGPTAGEEHGYSTSNYYDHANLFLNFPDSFAQAVKDAGIDLVSVANNHLLDMGHNGALRTIEVLDNVGLQHTGAYRNREEKEKILQIDVEGIKIAVLSYTFHLNGYKSEEFIDKFPYLTSFLPSKEDALFPQLMLEITNDFRRAKQTGADLIVVLPHMGTQFSHSADAFQSFWNQAFADLGADIILGDHAHAVQPIEQIGDTIVVNCPGNYANSYIQYNGDATAIVEIYIDRETKKPVATAVVPMYTQEVEDGYFRALPVYEILSQKQLYEQMRNIELERVSQVHELITDVMLGEKIDISNIQPRYFYIDERYRAYSVSMLDDFFKYENTALFQQITDASTVVFIGDSITNGSHNNGHPWYEPLMSWFASKEVINISQPACTVRNMSREFSEEIRQSCGDLYIVALGTNDVRYRDTQICAMTPQEYVADMDELVSLILEVNQEANIVFISPWVTLFNDTISQLEHEQKLKMISAYSDALRIYATEKGYTFLNPNKQLLQFFEDYQQYQYTADGVHPNETKGIDLYSWAVIESSYAAIPSNIE